MSSSSHFAGDEKSNMLGRWLQVITGHVLLVRRRHHILQVVTGNAGHALLVPRRHHILQVDEPDEACSRPIFNSTDKNGWMDGWTEYAHQEAFSQLTVWP
jgi:hypothetical protein